MGAKQGVKVGKLGEILNSETGILEKAGKIASEVIAPIDSISDGKLRLEPLKVGVGENLNLSYNPNNNSMQVGGDWKIGDDQKLEKEEKKAENYRKIMKNIEKSEKEEFEKEKLKKIRQEPIKRVEARKKLK